MTEELQQAIESIYSTFSVYYARSAIDGCPCCVSDADQEAIHSKSLRQLSEDDLAKYTFKAMTTWGDTADFKHYLPRIFELLATTSFPVDTFIVLGKLTYGDWRHWKKEEQDVLTRFLFAWWTDLIKNQSYFDKETFLEIYKLTGAIEPMLTRWNLSFEDYSFQNFVDLIHSYYDELPNLKAGFRELSSESIAILISWIKERKEILQNGFFYFEDQDKELAKNASIALCILEHAV
ncbi:hypothetical protein [Xanthocytophaga agilis]|uniref:Uncharacterized protein n=1 Tax=Xanthocytophaga agilis TaxID=3048010 RepID=A0AAE3UGG4_9BACT|nr:hypothetical protein [Xanthocytophaga agilis]MDJ1504913.1 hypothetical protein [Xanthocytophaga agilis]